MRASEFHLFTVKETPADAEVISHKLMLRAGMIRKLGAGLYTWSPLGLRVLRKVEAIVREEMDRAGALEMLMPAVQPAELWQETGRWSEFGPLLLKITDRGEREYCFGPTHEEVITDFARNEIRSYRQLPLNFYQVQMKFRDEIRPRFGVMRAREFLMKDAYSFHLTEQSLRDDGYQVMFDTYSRIFTRLGLRFRAVEADPGAIGGKTSHEFHVLAGSGEDAIAFSTQSDYAVNVELAEAIAPGERPAPGATLQRIPTPDVRTIADLHDKHGLQPERGVKTLVVESSDDGLIALILRGDHELNALKAERLAAVKNPLSFAGDAAIRAAVGAGPGSLGPVGLKIPYVVDRAAMLLADFACGANADGYHYTGVNWGRDAACAEVADLRNVQDGDPSPDGKGTLKIARGIEVGHVFQLGTKYSEAMGATVLDESGKPVPLWMGCYGIGITRIVAAAIEQNNDERGIIWPDTIAPFQVALLPMNMHKSQRLREAVEALYRELQNAGLEVLLDDRKQRPGVMFAEQELIGIPHRVVVSDKGLDAGQVEYQGRRDSESRNLPRNEVLKFLKDQTAVGAPPGSGSGAGSRARTGSPAHAGSYKTRHGR